MFVYKLHKLEWMLFHILLGEGYFHRIALFDFFFENDVDDDDDRNCVRCQKLFYLFVVIVIILA